MKTLEKEVALKGVGIQDLSASLIKRTKNVCWYERWDDVHEVFRPNVYLKGRTIFDRVYEEDTEMYPVNEDFGKTAFCFSNKESAEKCYNRLVDKFK